MSVEEVKQKVKLVLSLYQPFKPVFSTRSFRRHECTVELLALHMCLKRHVSDAA